MSTVFELWPAHVYKRTLKLIIEIGRLGFVDQFLLTVPDDRVKFNFAKIFGKNKRIRTDEGEGVWKKWWATLKAINRSIQTDVIYKVVFNLILVFLIAQ